VAQAVVGLGNPGPAYRDTRHNAGHRVVEALAGPLHARWARERSQDVARGRWQGETVYLVKPRSFMNVSGPVVARWCRTAGLGPEDLIVVFDDLDLPLGRVRARMKGSAGGHNGVRSLIEALGTEGFRRVKVGIGRPGEPGRDRAEVTDHVLSPFRPEEVPVMETACAEAVAQVLKLVERRTAERTR
jgi:PTH1 family peptidyl-tRNA hydrolase